MPFDSTEFEAPTTARKMMRLLGPEGEHWGRGNLYDSRTDRACLVGALLIAVAGKERLMDGGTQFVIEHGLPLTMWRSRDTINVQPSYAALMRAVREEKYAHASPIRFNDEIAQSFADIQRVLQRMHQIELTQMAEAL
jgi:hypothetical protein